MDAAVPNPNHAERQRRQADVVAALGAVLPPHAVLWRREETLPYECDGLTAYRQQPLVVALPETEDAGAPRCCKACHALQVPVVARGAGTGLSGGALPHAHGVTLSLAKFNRIVKVDPVARTARRAARRAQPRHQRGGRAARPVLRARPVEPDRLHDRRQRGRELRRRALPEVRPDAAQHAEACAASPSRASRSSSAPTRSTTPGYDLLALVVGSEGMLAVIDRGHGQAAARSREVARCVMASFDDIAKAGDAVAGIIAAGIIPAGLEMMDKPMTAAVEDFVHAGYDLDAAAILLCESDGTPEEVEEEIARMRAVLSKARRDAAGGRRDEAQRLKFWSGRKNAFPASGRISPDYMCMDSTIPRKRLAEMLRAITADGEQARAALRQRLPRRRRQPAPADPVRRQHADELHRAEVFGADILELCVAARRHGHRRARRRRRKDQLDVRAVRPAGAEQMFARQSAPSTRPGC